MSPKNAAETRINRTKEITRENRETGRHSEERRKTEILLNLPPSGDAGEVNAYEI